jgi:hypothetical protein
MPAALHILTDFGQIFRAWGAERRQRDRHYGMCYSTTVGGTARRPTDQRVAWVQPALTMDELFKENTKLEFDVAGFKA